MARISTKHPDVTINVCIRESLDFLKQIAQRLDEQENFYWRLAHFCNAQIVRGDPSSARQANIDPKESSYVLEAVIRLESTAAICFKDDPDQRISFYKRLHKPLADIAHQLHAERSGLIDTPFDHVKF